MGIEFDDVRGVRNRYANHETDAAVIGKDPSSGIVNTITLAYFADGSVYVGEWMPEGAVVLDATAHVVEAFSITGATGYVMHVGSFSFTEANNVIEIDEAQLETQGTVVYSDSQLGDYIGPLSEEYFTVPEATWVGGTPVISPTQGKLVIKIRYIGGDA